jgi:hypothetical protein
MHTIITQPARKHTLTWMPTPATAPIAWPRPPATRSRPRSRTPPDLPAGQHSAQLTERAMACSAALPASKGTGLRSQRCFRH